MAKPETDAAAAAWETPPRSDTDPDALIVDVGGFEGPLDLLLTLAKAQKVDLTRISILALAEQYLAFVERARSVRLELAGDYLVMAAWLAYLKSRLLLPPADSGDEPDGETLAGDLAFRLKRLEAMRDAVDALFARSLLGRDVFARGAPEPALAGPPSGWTASLYDLLRAYADRRQPEMVTEVRFARRKVWSLVTARECLVRLAGRFADWVPLDELVRLIPATGTDYRTLVASAFGASLEMAKDGTVELRQTGAFAPLYVRSRPGGPGLDGADGLGAQSSDAAAAGGPN